MKQIHRNRIETQTYRATYDDIDDSFSCDDSLHGSFTLGHLSTEATFPHKVIDQNGLNRQEIIANLRALSLNILTPLSAKFGGLKINSGFRQGSGRSQHLSGQAVDIQWPGKTPAEYSEMAQWVVDNLPYDQFIFEHGNSIWFHISFNKELDNQRARMLTFDPKCDPKYEPGINNHYDAEG